jgi:hypothetical protein
MVILSTATIKTCLFMNFYQLRFILQVESSSRTKLNLINYAHKRPKLGSAVSNIQFFIFIGDGAVVAADTNLFHYDCRIAISAYGNLI